MSNSVKELVAKAREPYEQTQSRRPQLEQALADRVETLEAWANGPDGVQWYIQRLREAQERIEALTASEAQARADALREVYETAQSQDIYAAIEAKEMGPGQAFEAGMREAVNQVSAAILDLEGSSPKDAARG